MMEILERLRRAEQDYLNIDQDDEDKKKKYEDFIKMNNDNLKAVVTAVSKNVQETFMLAYFILKDEASQKNNLKLIDVLLDD